MDALGDGGDIDIQRLNASGTPLWAAGGLAVCTVAFVQAVPIAVSDAAAGALVAWSDYRSGGSWDIYAQNISAAGSLGGTTLEVSGSAAPARLAIRCVGENPVRGVIRVECSLPVNGRAQVRLFDLSGRCVETQELVSAGAGRQFLEFTRSAAARAPGVYFARLDQGERSAAARLVSIR
jgi:hypothetical protein